MVQVSLVGSFSALFPSSLCNLEGTREDLVPGMLSPGSSHPGSPIKLGSWGSHWALPPPPPRPSPRRTKRERGWTTSSRVRAAPESSRAPLAPRHNPVCGAGGAAHPPHPLPKPLVGDGGGGSGLGSAPQTHVPGAVSVGEGAGCRGAQGARGWGAQGGQKKGGKKGVWGGAEPRPPHPRSLAGAAGRALGAGGRV